MIQKEVWYRSSSIEQDILRLGEQLIRTYTEEGKVNWEIVHRLKALEERSGKPVPFQFELDFGKMQGAAGHAYVESLERQLENQSVQRTFGLDAPEQRERPLYERVRLYGVLVTMSWGIGYLHVPVTSPHVRLGCTGTFRLSHQMDWDDELDTPAAVDDLREMLRGFPGTHTVSNIRVYPSANPDSVGDTVQGEVTWDTPLDIPLQESWVSDIKAAT